MFFIFFYIKSLSYEERDLIDKGIMTRVNIPCPIGTIRAGQEERDLIDKGIMTLGPDSVSMRDRTKEERDLIDKGIMTLVA